MTFSMVARCPRTLALGVCVATASLAVGNRVPHVRANVGAIATQAKTSILHGIMGLKLLGRGFHPKAALETLLSEDLEREARQVVVIDVHGRVAAFTGEYAADWKGHFIGEDCVAAGNRLVGGWVLEAMVRAFEGSEGNLAERLMRALEAGQAAGGDRLWAASAALLVAEKESPPDRLTLDLRVDESPDPIGDLRRLFETPRRRTETNKTFKQQAPA